ncbi:PD-(D/E)XK nuclease family protein [Rudanella lutea]|uniref:PD-(D/E)XK nuclease family protein n=1 Tax=Rudanella lutea TaxID=451374 RepID=UPI00037B69DB|nr:PD-(D/E)XK nuclease family protein [Rudanella lutea]
MNFLQQTARTVFDKHPKQAGQSARFDHVWVILPTRRAVSVFLDELGKLSDEPFLAPHAMAIDDFVTEAAGVQLIDQVGLLFELFEVFRVIDPQVEFEQFIGWASVLLTDFDRIDQYLVKADFLFDYLTEAKTLERWQLDLPPGSRSLTPTPAMSRYFKLFENLKTAYHALHERLTGQGLAYRGMAYRLLAEQVREKILDNPAYEKVYFVGFNALSKAESQIMESLLRANKAEMIWDVDRYYLDDKKQEAGLFLRRYTENGYLFTRENRAQIGTNLTTLPKHIRVVGVPNASMQTKVAGQIYKEWRQASEGEGPDRLHQPKTAIILADESLLVPMLYALDESVTDLNITMGLSLRDSLLFTLVDTLFEMQRTVHEFRTRDGRDLRIPKFHFRHVVKVLNHPFVQHYARLNNLMSVPESADEQPRPLLLHIQEQILTRQWVYLTEGELRQLGHNDRLLKTLFWRWPADQPTEIIGNLYRLIDLLRAVYSDTQDAVEIEYLYVFYTLLQQLETTIEQQAQIVNGTPITLRSLRQFLYELVRQTSIPFTSEGDSPLQVMGMLETRALDFERVIILSVNEGVLPQARKQSSLIPLDISIDKQIQLPTYRDQESVTAYHFYRLLQRAREVVLIHTTSPDAYGNGKGEPSRFIRQIEHELVPRSAGAITLSTPLVRFGRERTGQEGLMHNWEVAKSPEVMEKLRTNLATRGIYPTALNQFINCSLSFYFSRVAGIAEEEEVEEKMGAAEFGDWLHKTLENLDKKYRMDGRVVSLQMVKDELEETFKEVMKGRVMESGINLLLYDVAQRLMLDFQERQAQLTDLQVIGTEDRYIVELNVPLETGEVVPVRIGGKIDRIEQVDGQIRIIDYKTGKVELPSQSADMATMLPLETGSKWDKARQLWLYKYLFLKQGKRKNPHDLPVTAGFYSFRDINGGLKENPVWFSSNTESPDEFIRASEETLRTLLRRLLDPGEAFRKTEKLETCTYCDFRRICGRE